MIIKKKLLFYLTAITIIVIMCLMTTFAIYGKEMWSVLKLMGSVSKKELNDNGISLYNIILCTTSQWLYLISFIVVIIPSVSYVYDELKDKLFTNIEIRKGRLKYIYSRCFYSLMSGGITISISMIIYFLIISCKFPVINYLNDSNYNETIYTTLFTAVRNIGLYFIYGSAISLVGTLCVIVYQDLIFDLCVVFIILYFTKDYFINNVLWFPLVIIIVILTIIARIWCLRRESL